MEIYCRTLDNWPREFTENRKRKPFKARFDATLRALKYELNKLEATTVIVQSAFPEREISTTSGWPRADRRPAHPGVIVAADTKHGALKWVCDDCKDWTDNVHAIALTLERLRLADIYGVTRRGEQYTGWKMLPGPITAGSGGSWSPPTMTMEEAARFVSKYANVPAEKIMRDSTAWGRAYRHAVLKLHPDSGGTPELWQQAQDAAQLLNGLHSRK